MYPRQNELTYLYMLYRRKGILDLLKRVKIVDREAFPSENRLSVFERDVIFKVIISYLFR